MTETRRSWAGTEGDIGREVSKVSTEILAAYAAAPRLVDEHHNLEVAAVEGGYGRRQLFELIQNGADELLGQHGRIEVVLTEHTLYCANQGHPLSVDGIRALQYSHLSAKRGIEIGRFGLGFKSVLGITRTPEIFSTTGSVRFDRENAKERIEAALGRPPSKVPVLRLAAPLDPEEARTEDSVLAELMSWATTVVRLRRDSDDSSWLHDNVLNFPAAFLLFSPHVERLVLEDRTADVRRVIALQQTEGGHLLVEGANESRWRVFQTSHVPSDRARADAGRHADREEIPIAWAVPTDRRRRGEFWAFFPTLDTTTLSGVLNAPWKLNEDRTRVIDGTFNQELLEAASALVISKLGELAGDDDPGLVLDLLPGRGRELLGWADERVTTCINETVGLHPCIPDQDGVLRAPAGLKIHSGGIPRDALDLWAASPGRPSDWAHPSIETRERRPRVEMYMATSASIPRPTKLWIEKLVANADPESSARAIQVAELVIAGGETSLIQAVGRANIVLTESGELKPFTDPNLFLRAPLPLEVKADYVDGAVADLVGELLLRLGVRRVAPIRLLAAMLTEDPGGWDAARWDLLWEIVRRSDPVEVKPLFDEVGLTGSRLQVRSAAGQYIPFARGLLPGTIIPQLSVDDRAVLIDTAFHSGELQMLQILGAGPAPRHNGGRRDEAWFTEYEKAALDRYLEETKRSGAAPNREYLKFVARPFVGPLAPLRRLSDAGRARHVAAVLSVAQDLKPWTFGHSTQNRYPTMEFPNPALWMIEKYGIIETSLGLKRPHEAVGPTLRRYSDVLPVADIRPDAAEGLRMPARLDQLSARAWASLLERVSAATTDATIGLAYVAAAANKVACPALIRCRVGQAFDMRSPDTVAVAADQHHAGVFTQTAQPFVRVGSDEDEASLVERWGLRPARDTVRTQVTFTPAGEAEPLIDAFPLLRSRLDDAQRELQLVPCSELLLETFTDGGKLSADRQVVFHEGSIYHRAELTGGPLLGGVSRALGLGLGPADIEELLRNLDINRIRELRSKIRAADDDADRLLLAVGQEALRRRISRPLLDAVQAMHGQLDERGIAQLALVVHGVRVLQEHSEDLDSNGLQPPAQWAGRRRAVAFVRSLGFGQEFAGFESSTPAATLEVEGRPDLGPLHDYQRVIVGEIRSLLRGQEGYRGLLSLPTGAGKTRVTVEAIVDAMSSRELDGPVLWVAQTEELCEQAVQTWSEIWRALGPTRRLTISRLWSQFEAEQAEHGEQVVVATISKLDARVYEKTSYKWLTKASCLVVDEAHTSVGPQYTRLLEWQGMGRGKSRAPLLGLTATPFRGTNVEETQRLVARYGARRLDHEALGGADAYPHLQAMGILSKVEHMLLPGSELSLSAAELAELESKRVLPPTVGRALGEDVERNRTLVESISQLDPGWPVLVFASSKEHAEILAALLVKGGVSAAAITGETDRGARRHYIEQFRRGGLRVLTNFQVLTAGFDAPKVRAVFVARPTYSANLYQQMVGRGLRGPLNGGTDSCLLVNVADNVLQYGEQLAFHDFDYLWGGGEPDAASRQVTSSGTLTSR